MQTYFPSPAGTPCAERWHCWRRQWTPQRGAGRPCKGSGGPPAEPFGDSTQLWSDLCEGLEQDGPVSKEETRKPKSESDRRGDEEEIVEKEVGREGVFEEEKVQKEQKKKRRKEKELGNEKNMTGKAPALHYKPAFIYIR